MRNEIFEARLGGIDFWTLTTEDRLQGVLIGPNAATRLDCPPDAMMNGLSYQPKAGTQVVNGQKS